MSNDETILVGGKEVGQDADPHVALAGMLAGRGIDPARLADPTPVLDPRGDVFDRDELIEHLTTHALRALSVVADGEFAPDRLPPMNKQVARWLDQHRQDPQAVPTLVLQGVVGCGKTSQLIQLLRELVLWHIGRAEHFRWHFVKHRVLAAALQPNSGRDPEALKYRLLTADFVAFDDLGDFRTTDWGQAADFTSILIDHRAHHRMPTVYSTNLPYKRTAEMAEAERIHGPIAVLADTLDGRAISRLTAGWTIAMPEIDYRASQGQVLLG